MSNHRGSGPRRDPWFPPKVVLDRDVCAHCGKVLYDSRGDATSAIKRIGRDGKGRGGTDSVLNAYECPSGHGWHIAHRRSQGRRTGAAHAPARAAAPVAA